VKIAIFGGTFDPIHRAHLEIARQAIARFQLDRVLLVPAAQPPHKGGTAHASYEHRVRMACLAATEVRGLEVSRLEEAATRSYSIRTIEKVRAEMAPGDQLFFLIGADAFAEIRTWHRWNEVAGAVCFLVVSRPDRAYEIPPGVRVERLDDLDLRISSSEIRASLESGGRPPEVPEQVLYYIEANGLYGIRDRSEFADQGGGN
jgi:nicotinate-nucleotide adenylyltransferase